MLALLALVLPAVLAAAPASTPLGSIKSDNGTLHITSAPSGTITVNEVDLMAALASMQNNIAALQATVAALQTTATSQGNSIDSQGSAIGTLQSITDSQGSNIASLLSNVAGNTMAISGLTTTVNGIIAADSTQNNSISLLTTSATIAAANITTLFSKTATLNATQITQGNSITTLQSNLGLVQTTVNNQGANITTLFTTTATTNNGLATSNSNIVALNASIQTTINTNIASLTTNINALNASVVAWEGAPIIPPLGSVACTSSNIGALRLNASSLEICVVSGWIIVNPNIGSSPGYPVCLSTKKKKYQFTYTHAFTGNLVHANPVYPGQQRQRAVLDHTDWRGHCAAGLQRRDQLWR